MLGCLRDILGAGARFNLALRGQVWPGCEHVGVFVEQMRAEAGGLTGAPKGEGESVQCGGRGRGLGLQGGLREEGSCKAIF